MKTERKALHGALFGRRDFIAGGAASLGAWLAGCAGADAARGAYSVAVLGDTHFDSPDSKRYHANYTHSTTRQRYEGHLAEHVRNGEMWSDRMPRLVRASAACVRADTAFALQMGDLVQGDCGRRETYVRMLDDAFGFIKGAYGGRLPLVTVVGNHDIRGDIKGDGALEAFDAWQPAVVKRELGIDVKGTTFSFRQGPDVFIVVDFNDPHIRGHARPCDSARRGALVPARDRRTRRRAARAARAPRSAQRDSPRRTHARHGALRLRNAGGTHHAVRVQQRVVQAQAREAQGRRQGRRAVRHVCAGFLAARRQGRVVARRRIPPVRPGLPARQGRRALQARGLRRARGRGVLRRGLNRPGLYVSP